MNGVGYKLIRIRTYHKGVKTTMRKIAFVITDLYLGGAEIQVCNLSDELSRKGYIVKIITLTGDAIISPEDKKIEILPLLMDKGLFSFIRAYLHARKHILNFQPDIVHSHLVHGNIFSRLLRVTTPIPKLISTSHSSYEGGRLRALICRITDPLTTISTNVSHEATECIVKRGSVNHKKIQTIYNGINIEKFRFNEDYREKTRREIGIDCYTPLLLSVGRLTPAKDYHNLLRAFTAIKGRMPVDPQLVIIGGGPLESELKSLAATLGIANRVHWLGIKTNINEWMSAADIFVLSSAWEGFGLVVAEAMTAERVVVATDCGGIKEVLGGNGFLVPPDCSPALAESIITALNLSPEDARKMGAASRSHVEQYFSMSAITQKWLALYRSL
ncbi:glycosyltransferase involved in cell wall biosynthesis [Pantoea agglomerans]|jgi:glycosyltransferase involved in cell wall biosynthesis